MVHDPPILLLDEPTTGLDPQARRLLWETLRELHGRGLSIILTTHYMEEADRLCQRLAIIDHGKILTADTPEALKRSLPGGQILDLWVKGADALGPSLVRIQGVLRHEEVEVDLEERDGLNRLRLFVEPRDGVLDDILHAVREGKGTLHHVSLATPSLEDVYIHLTGKELRE
jgi:ABC-2 type transport system ATP-binding protein